MTSPAALADEFSRSGSSSSNGTSQNAETTPRDNTTLTNNERPDIPHPAYERMQPRWNKCRALMGGTEAIRAGGTDFLPQMPNESSESYDYRSQLVALFNGFARTVKACAGLINQKEPVLGADMPEKLVAMWENADRSGTHGAVMTSQLTLSGMVDGFGGIFVDYPRPDDPNIDRSKASAAAVPGAPLSGDDVARLGLSPYFIRYRADDVIKAIYQVVNGVKTLVLLVLREASDVRVGPFGIETLFRYRVYTNEKGVVRYELWERLARVSTPNKVQDARVMTNVNAIPWSPFVAGDVVDQNETRPPLNDLADLNLEHHAIKTNIRYLEDRAFVPALVRIGASRDPETGTYPPVEIGPKNTIEVPLIDGLTTQPIYWMSPDVSVLDPGNKSLANVEQQMGASGLAFLNPEFRRAETAEAKRIDASAQNASLISVARALQDCLETAFQFAAQYINEPAGSVTINTDFEEVVMDPAMIAQLVAARQSGNLSIETFLQLLEKGKVLEDGFDVDGEKKRILEENANTLKSMGVDSGNPPPGDGTGSPNQ
jgi:hypothetical protein